MFSATFPDDIQVAAQDFLNDYLFLTVGMVGGACSDVQQEFHEVAKFDKREKLEELMQDPARDPKERTLIFVQVIAFNVLASTRFKFASLDQEKCRLFGQPLVSGRASHHKYSRRQASKGEGGGAVRFPCWQQADLSRHCCSCPRLRHTWSRPRNQLRHARRRGRVCP